MSKKKENLTGTINKIIPATMATYSEEEIWSATNGWSTVDQGGITFLTYQTYIDLGTDGDNRDLTFFPEVRALLDPGYYKSTVGSTASYAADHNMLTLLSSGRLFLSRVAEDIDANGQDGIPGYTGSRYNWYDIIVGNYTVLQNSADLGDAAMLTKLRNTFFGSMEPSNNMKLWVSKLYWVTSDNLAPNETIELPPTRVVVNGRFEAESTGPYAIRLLRSYELQQTP
jgi:hypothetical protein|tara:strand:- start:511 stop:1191 length:681 start_codon:yes stop_codon:yes gene_type:complete